MKEEILKCFLDEFYSFCALSWIVQWDGFVWLKMNDTKNKSG